MSVAEILAELPKLDPLELQLVLKQAVELQKNGLWEASPELAKAIEEAMAVPEEDCIDIEEAFRRVKSWNSK
jgi:hypothetical protein